jgi:hypothetical protein
MRSTDSRLLWKNWEGKNHMNNCEYAKHPHEPTHNENAHTKRILEFKSQGESMAGG